MSILESDSLPSPSSCLSMSLSSSFNNVPYSDATDSLSSATLSLSLPFDGSPFQLDGTAMDEFERERRIGGLNVAEDLRRGRGVRAIIVSTSGLSGRFAPRIRDGFAIGFAGAEAGTGGRPLSFLTGVET